MTKKKKILIKSLIASISLILLSLTILIVGIFTVIFIIKTNLILRILVSLIIVYSSFVLLVYGWSYLKVLWAMKITLYPFFRIKTGY